MDSRTKFRSALLVVLLSLVPLACSSSGTSRVKVSSMCEKSGGTYVGGTCQPASNPQTAAQLCSNHGGVYMAGGDYCEVDNSLFWKP